MRYPADPTPMNRNTLQTLLEDVRTGALSIEEGLGQLEGFPIRDLGHTRVDTHRDLRQGFPEVIFGEGKSEDELIAIAEAILDRHEKLLVTRVDAEASKLLKEHLAAGEIHRRARAFTVGLPDPARGEGFCLVVSAGTSDGPVAEEAWLTARMLGARTEILRDVGVAGIHRVLEHSQTLREARAIVVVAGMEGALPSVVGGLTERPVIAVPTSVGYGASFGGLAALLGMLNSCAAGVSVVNIDNGFGAGYAAALINRKCDRVHPVGVIQPAANRAPSPDRHPIRSNGKK